MSQDERSSPPQPERSDYFVTTVDLSKSRPAPEENSLFEIIASSSWSRLLGLLGYLIYAAVAWAAVGGMSVDITVAGILFGLVVSLPYFGVVFIRAINAQRRTGTPVYRDIIFISDFTQTIFLFLIALAVFILFSNLVSNLAESDLRINFNVLNRDFGTEVTEGPDPNADLTFLQTIPIIGEPIYNLSFLQPDTNTRALLVGLINTLRVVIISLIFSTILGVLLGIGLLSSNWLVRTASGGYVEIFRNTPLLLQLFFIYRGILGFLPSRPADAIELPGGFFFSGRGLNYPALVPTETWPFFLVSVLIGAVIGAVIWRQRLKQMEETGQPANVLLYFSGSVVTGIVVGTALAFVMGGSPITTELPELGRFRFTGGASFSAEYLALALGLILYTSAFISDIVRAGIQSVPKGQIEAAYAHGLTQGQTLQLVVLPQAMRLILPPLTNQYLNLAKNSSLGIAIGFLDVYNVANIIQNQTGQAVALFAVLMVTYLTLSLIISLIMNTFNSSRQYKTR